MSDRTVEPDQPSPTPDPESADPESADLDLAGEAPRAERFADEIVARRLARPSRRAAQLIRVLLPVVGVLVAIIVRASAESVGVGPEVALAMAASVLVSALVLTAAVHFRYFDEP